MMKLFLVLLSIVMIASAKTNYEIYKESLKKNDLKSAKIYLLKAINESFENDDISKISQKYQEIADLYKKTKTYYKAVEYYKLSLKLALSSKKTKATTFISIYKNLSFCYGKIGNTFKTFKYSYKAVELANKKYGRNSKVSRKLTKEVAKIQSHLIENSI